MPRLLVAFVADDAVDLESKEGIISALRSQTINSSFEISYETTLQLLEDQKAIKTSHHGAARHVDANTEAGQKVIESLAQAEKRVARSRDLVDRMYNTIPGIARPATDASAAKAQEVFTTPELLENILAFSKPSDILTAMRVQHCFKDTVLASIHLKRRLGLAPFDDKHYYSPLSARHFSASRDLESSSLKGLIAPGIFYDDVCVPEHDQVDDPNKVHNFLSIGIDVNDAKMHPHGPRTQNVIMSNIPVMSLMVIQTCGLCRKLGRKHKQYRVRQWIQILSSSAHGFTLGELTARLDEAKQNDGHQDCLDIRYRCTTSFILDDDDPIMIKRREYAAKAVQHRLDLEERSRRETRCMDEDDSESSESSESSVSNESRESNEDDDDSDGNESNEQDQGSEDVGSEQDENSEGGEQDDITYDAAE